MKSSNMLEVFNLFLEQSWLAYLAIDLAHSKSFLFAKQVDL